MQEAALSPSDLAIIIHGTTLVTNALLTGRLARVGMLTTEGFRDLVEIRRGQKNVHTSMYDIFVPPYRPIVPREAVGDRNQDAHDANLYDIDAKYGDVVPLESVLDHLGELAAAHAR